MNLIAINAACAFSALALALRGVVRPRIALRAVPSVSLVWVLRVRALPAAVWNSLFLQFHRARGRDLWHRAVPRGAARGSGVALQGDAS